jgi:hypothetical protein
MYGRRENPLLSDHFIVSTRHPARHAVNLTVDAATRQRISKDYRASILVFRNNRQQWLWRFVLYPG